MATSVNGAGLAHARSLIAAGKVNNGEWSFSGADGNSLLGSGGDDWANFGKWFLATHSDQPEKTKGHYGYPFGKNGEVYRRAVANAAARASAAGASEVASAAESLTKLMDSKKGSEPIRAYSLFSIKSIDEEERSFRGIATTPAVDRMEDIVDPLGGVFKLPLPMLWQHGKGTIKDPVGWITEAAPNNNGIAVSGKFQKPRSDYPQSLVDDLQKAWVMVRDGLVRGLSIGFNPLESEPIKGSFGSRYTKWEWLELSPVAIAANQEATIQAVKSFDVCSASAAKGVFRLPPRVVGNTKAGVFRLPTSRNGNEHSTADQDLHGRPCSESR